MTPQQRHQAARNASEELRDLVGTHWTLGGISRQEGDGGLDCIGLMVEAYTVIGRHLAEPERWRFPIPLSYPYPAKLPDGSWMPEEDIAEWARHFRLGLEPAFGLGVTFLEDHIGVLLEPPQGRGFDVLHSHRNNGVVLHPLNRVANWATGFYRLRRPRVDASELAAT